MIGNKTLIVYTGLIAATAVWLAMIVAAPWLLAKGQILPAALAYHAFSAVCHQLYERSFTLYGHPLGVCSRCTGIYGGFGFGLILYPFLRSLKEVSFPARWI